MTEQPYLETYTIQLGNNILYLNSDHSSIILNNDATPQTRTISPKLFITPI